MRADADVLYSRTPGDGLCLPGFRSVRHFRQRWTAGVLASRSIICARTTRTAPTVLVGGVRDRITRVAPHGRIAGCRIDPDLASTDDYNPYLRAAAARRRRVRGEQRRRAPFPPPALHEDGPTVDDAVVKPWVFGLWLTCPRSA
ncbi:hypothetical protein EEB14_35210 [Rhodococcus sp. WS4]|nr:hypothetical protein EEB14_35210 [Rhodococcus sp. WS4]